MPIHPDTGRWMPDDAMRAQYRAAVGDHNRMAAWLHAAKASAIADVAHLPSTHGHPSTEARAAAALEGIDDRMRAEILQT